MPCAVVVLPVLPGADALGEEPGFVEPVLLELDVLAVAGFDPLWVVGVSVGVGQGTIVEFGFAGLLLCEPEFGDVDCGVPLGACGELCPELCPDGLVGLGVADVGGLVGDVGGVVAPVGGLTLGVEACPA